MDRLNFINELYPESKRRIDDKSNLTWNNIIFLLGLFEKENKRQGVNIPQDLIEFRDKLKASSEMEYNYASVNDNEEISRLELSFSNLLLKFSKDLNEILHDVY